MSSNARMPLDRAAAPPLLPFHDVVNVTSANDDAHTPGALSRGSANPTSPFKDNEWSEHTKEGEILANLLDFEDPREEEERALFDSIRDSDDPPDVGVDSDQAEALPSTAMDQGYRALEDYKELDDEATGMEHLGEHLTVCVTKSSTV
ncbi:hypothetical protein TRAPUB_2725 [Trametes pubescens]|uniref:Uncharacterized protein n=1 Tax=Trametes pubescens TaxID=154538 RepID=A0A1M2VFU0_TRAPU|nr:hypothetical protein TRAPUB_2725 [Trametes pubescens]